MSKMEVSTLECATLKPRYGLGLVVFVLSVVVICTIGLVIKMHKSDREINNLVATTTQLGKCVTTLEQVHLVTKDGTILHATIETSGTATALDDNHTTRTPALSE